ncbi:MAG: hypothetical protein FJY91_02155 [Candidatus Harrisonbacteria bacterium]|nr:hypothetical protein [Candidatus Harrisonbacteria bacterium]
MNESLKRWVYGGVYLFLFLALLGLIYFSFYSTRASCDDLLQNQDETGVDCGGKCAVSCEVKWAEPIVITARDVFIEGVEHITVMVTVYNPNAFVGVMRLPYTLSIYDTSGKRAFVFHRETKIIPGGNTYLLETNVKLKDRDFGRVEVTWPEYVFTERGNLNLPNLLIQDVATKKMREGIVIFGGVKNEEPAPVSEVIIIVQEREGLIIKRATQSVLSQIPSYGRKEFILELPMTAEELKKIDSKNLNLVLQAK